MKFTIVIITIPGEGDTTAKHVEKAADMMNALSDEITGDSIFTHILDHNNQATLRLAANEDGITAELTGEKEAHEIHSNDTAYIKGYPKLKKSIN